MQHRYWTGRIYTESVPDANLMGAPFISNIGVGLRVDDVGRADPFANEFTPTKIEVSPLRENDRLGIPRTFPGLSLAT